MIAVSAFFGLKVILSILGVAALVVIGVIVAFFIFLWRKVGSNEPL